jgi:hypothetical protein
MDFPDPKAVLHYHRSQLSQASFQSPEVDNSVWDTVGDEGRYLLDIEIGGEVVKEDDSVVPYNNTLLAYTNTGRHGLINDLQARVKGFVSTKNALKEGGSGGHGKKLNLRTFSFTLYGFVPAGGCSKKGEKKGLKLLTGNFPVMVIGEKLGYADKTKNNCLFRSIYFMLSGTNRKTFKSEKVPRPSEFKKDYGLRAGDPVPMDIALRMADDLGVQLGITVVEEDGRSKRYTSAHYNNLHYRYYGIEIILSVAEGHYYPYLDGALPLPAEDANGSKKKGKTIRFECATCGEEEDYAHYIEHMREHRMERDAFVRGFKRNEPLLPKEEGESDEAYSKRSTDYYLGTIYDFHDSEYKDSMILWFCGPGGCGKSYVIHQLVEQEGDDKVFRLAYTGTASAAIGGVTTKIWYNLAKGKKLENEPEFVVIDEVSMMTAEHFDEVIKMIRKSYGSVTIIIMGDLLQLQPIVDDDDVSLRHPCLSPLFQEQVFCVPMTYGFRYPNKAFYDFLLNVRMGNLFSEEFMQQGFTVKSRSQILNDYDVTNRPMILTMSNKQVTSFCAEIHRKEKDREMYRISSLAYDLVLNKDHQEENQRSQLGGPPKDVLRRMARNLFKAEPSDIKVVPLRGAQDKRFTKTTESNDYDCEICMEFIDLYPGQKLMVLKNYCGTDRALRNGDEVTFVREDAGGMVVREKSGREVRVQQYWRYVDPGPYVQSVTSLKLGKGYPVKPLYASTIDKSQGATYETIAIYLPRGVNYTRAHLFYVAISRCRRGENVIFVLDDAVYNRFTNDRVRLRHVYEQLCQKLVKVNQLCQKTMEWAEQEERAISEFTELHCAEQIFDETIFPSNNNITYWNPKIPKSSRKLKDQRKGYRDRLLNDFILFDIETGAASGFEDHPHFFNEEGKWIKEGGKDKLKQAWWMVGAIHYHKSEVVRCASVPEMKRFAPYQTGPNGELIFQRGLVDDGSEDDNDWCSRIFFEYLLAWMHYRKRRLEETLKKRRDPKMNLLTELERAPTYLCGFNSDSFDILGVLQQFAFHSGWQKDFNVHITPNSGGSITQLTISTPVNKRKNMWRVLASHDIYRLLGQMGSLDGCHKSYVSQYKKDVETFLRQLGDYSTSHRFKTQMREGINLGKGKFPHFVTQREGYKAALDDTVREYKLIDFPEKDREELEKNPELLRLNLKQVSRQYMLQDLWSTLALYVCFDIQLQKKLHLSTLHLSTAQQLTTARFLHEELGGDFVLSKRCNTRTGRDEFTTALPIYPSHTNKFIEESIYGGKTLPRVRFWESKDPETDYYMGGDVGGLYAYCQQEFPYPYGKYLHTSEPKYCQAIMGQWKLAKEFGSDYMMFPENSKFPYLFIARVRLRMPATITDSGVPFRESDGSINWGIGANGERYQALNNVHLAMAMDDGAELLEVTEVVFWYRQSKGMAGYLKKLNTEKYEAKDPGTRNFAKLLANAFYGSTLKRAHHSIVHITKNGGGAALDSFMEIIERDNCHVQFNPNGTLRIQAELKDNGKRMSDRSTHLGSWVLGYSHHVTHRVNRIARGETHLPTTRNAMIEALRFQILYSDTDSAYFHKTHLDRILLWEASQTPDNYVLYQNPERNPGLTAKLGKYADEWEQDDSGYVPDFAAGNLVKVLRFGSNAPKSYTAYGVTPTGQEIWKSRCKGVPVYRARLWMKSAEDEEMNEGGVKFDPKSHHVHELMWQAICSTDLYLQTKAEQCIKRHGMIVRKHEVLEDAEEGLHRADPWDIAINNVERRICRDGEDLVWKKRRRLTEDEAAFLGFDEREQMALLVPTDFNYDGSLFDLV